MSCTVMYQPYAMSYSSSSCERTNSSLDKAPSPPDSLISDTSSYNSPGPIITMGTGGNGHSGPGSVGSSSTPLTLPLSLSLTGASTSSSVGSLSVQLQRRPLSPTIPLSGSSNNNNSMRSSTSSSRASASSSSSSRHHHHDENTTTRGGSTSTGYDGRSTSTASPIPSISHQHHHNNSHHHNHHHHHHLLHPGLISNHQSSSSRNSSTSNTNNNNSSNAGVGASGGGSSSQSQSPNQRAQYVSANCVVFVHYNGDVARVVDEHFTKALTGSYEKSAKSLPMSTRNFPPSFWNSNYQPSKPLASYGADFYGAAVDYGTPLAGLAAAHHHHQADAWHYPLPPPHQSYHARTTDIPYPAMPSTSRFNAAQYGSFLLAGAAASSASSRFTGVMPGSSQCGMKGNETMTSGWAGGRYHPHHHHHHHHESLSDLHLADYSAAAAAHYSTMTAGLESSAQESSSKDLYWF